MSGGRISACEVNLVDDGRMIARGVVPIDDDEGAPPVICWQGDVFVKFLKVDALALYRKTRVFHAGDCFEVVS